MYRKLLLLLGKDYRDIFHGNRTFCFIICASRNIGTLVGVIVFMAAFLDTSGTKPSIWR